MTDIVVESNVPLPAECSPCPGRAKYPFSSMAIGDSFETDNPTASTAAYNYGRRHGSRFQSMKTPNDTYRIWRVE